MEGDVIAQIGPGLVILICAMVGDTSAEGEKLAAKIAKLRIFRDDTGKTNRSVADVAGEILVVSQFTLAADTSRGNRPGFSNAAAPDEGKRLYLEFCDHLRGHDLPVQTGKFGAEMAVALTNDGPMTIWLEV